MYRNLHFRKKISNWLKMRQTTFQSVGLQLVIVLLIHQSILVNASCFLKYVKQIMIYVKLLGSDDPKKSQ